MKTHVTAKIIACITVLSIIIVFNGCQDSTSPNLYINNPSGQSGTLEGVVTTTNNVAVPNVEVRVGAVVGYTNNRGEYFLRNIPTGDRVLVNFANASYATTQKVAEIKAGKTTTVDASLLAIGRQQTVNAGTGGSVQFNGAKVDFPANAFVDSKGSPFTGNALVKATYFNPTSGIFYGCFPGEFSGVQQSGTETAIESFGYINVELLNGAEKLQLAPSTPATITVPIPASLGAKAPQTIPLWYYDEQSGKWKEEGSATKSGNTYVGTVSHFSSWNCDQPTMTSYLEGMVVDKNGNPISFASVHTTGVDYIGTSMRHTDDNGRFKIAVKSSSNAQIWATVHGFISPKQTVATPATGLSTDIGTLVVPIDTANVCVILGRLVDNGSRPVSGAVVNLKDKSSGATLDYVITTADGKFQFYADLNTSYVVETTLYIDSVSTPTRIDVTTPAQGGIVDLGDIKLDIGGATITGRIVDSNGNPAAGATIYMREINGGPGQTKSILTDATGTFSLWVRPNETLDIYIYYMQKQNTVTTTSPGLGETKDLGDIVVP